MRRARVSCAAVRRRQTAARVLRAPLSELTDASRLDCAVLELLRLDPEAIASGQRNPGTLVTNELKLQVKFGRQMGVHVSPTTTWNGLVCDTSSGWSAVEWAAFLDPLLEKAAQA